MLDAADVILLAYGACNTVRVVSYVPQIVRIARDKQGASAISLSCWWLWIAANATTALYAWVNLGDAPLALLNVLNTLCCLAVVVLTMCKRLQASPSVAHSRHLAAAARISR